MKHPGDIVKSDMSSEGEIQSLTKYREQSPFQFSPSGGADFEEEGALGFRDYCQMVRSRLWLILAITLLVTALAVIYAARQPDIYEAEARIQVDLEKDALGGSKNGAVII